MSIPSQASGIRLLVQNISNENLILFSGVQINAGVCLDIFEEDPTITEARALDDMVNPVGSLYCETTIRNRVRIIDFDTETISPPSLIRGSSNKIVFGRAKEETFSTGGSVSVRPSIGTSAGGIYSTFPLAYAAARAMPGEVKIWFEEATTIPAGVYDLENRIAFAAKTLGPPVTITCSQDCVFQNPHAFTGNMKITTTSTNPVILVESSRKVSFAMSELAGFTPGTSAILSVLSGGNCTIIMENISGIDQSGLVGIVDGFLGLFMLSGATYLSSNFTGSGTFFVAVRGGGINAPALDSFSGSEILNLGTGAGASTVNYTPAVTGDWTGDDPTTIQEALDRIAAAITPVG